MDIAVDPRGCVTAQGRTWRAALGRSGVGLCKREGDGLTPAGRWPLLYAYYRADRLAAPATGLPVQPLHKHWGWCDDPHHPDYNTRVDLPHPARHEKLWRDDHAYDVVVVLGYNTDPIVPGAGSAIFLHVAKPGYPPTEGCIALEITDLLCLLQMCNEGDTLTISPPGGG